MAAHRLMLEEDFCFGLGWEAEMTWGQYLHRLESVRLGVDLAEDRVPMTFLVAEVDATMVGRVSIRHRLNEFLMHEGGHIGFGVVPGQRRRGYATDILRQSLALAGELAISPVLVACDEDNRGSAKVIERCGGVLESTVLGSDGHPVRRYWIG